MSDNWEEILNLLARFVADDDAERARCGPEAPSLAHVERARALLKSVRFPHLATENARLRSMLGDMVSVFTDRGEERHPDEETALAEARAMLAGKPVADARRVTLETEVDRRVKSIMANREKYVEAWIAETGMKPSECQLIEQMSSDMATRVVRASPAPQPDAVKVLREACEWYAREFADIDAHSGTTSGTWERLATHANDRLRAALAATEGV